MSSQLRSLARQAASWATKLSHCSHPAPHTAAARAVRSNLAAAAEAARSVRSYGSITLALPPSQTFTRQLRPIMGRYHGLSDRSELRQLSTEAAEGENKDKQGEAEDEAKAGEEEVDADEEGSQDTEDEKYNELLEQVKAKDAEVADFKDRALRALAELENVRERTKRELEQGKRFAVQSIVKELLDVCDNLERALNAAKIPDEGDLGADTAVDSAAALKSLHEGVQMTEQQLLGVMRRVGVERFDPQPGDEFDPNVHSALFEVPAQSVGEDAKPGSVGVVTKVGYKMHDRVIRPAEVGVVRAD